MLPTETRNTRGRSGLAPEVLTVVLNSLARFFWLLFVRRQPYGQRTRTNANRYTKAYGA